MDQGRPDERVFALPCCSPKARIETASVRSAGLGSHPSRVDLAIRVCGAAEHGTESRPQTLFEQVFACQNEKQ